jgi:hypothetical protein
MQIEIQTENVGPYTPTRVGNVYAVRGGRGMRYGHMQILIAITEPRESYQSPMGLMLVITKDGKPAGVSSYGMHYIDELQAIAFVEGIEDMTLIMRSI